MKTPTKSRILAERQEIIAALDERILQSDADFSLAEKVRHLVQANTEFINERLEILDVLKRRNPPQFDEEFPLEVRIAEMVKREKALCDTINHQAAQIRELRVRAYFGIEPTQGQIE